MNASNRKEVREAEKAAKLAEEARRNFLVAAMSTTEGRAWINELLEFCQIFIGDFTGDALTEAFYKGHRNVGLKVFNQINLWCPDSYIQMIKEANYGRSTAAELARGEDRNRGVEGAEPDLDDSAFVDDPFLQPFHDWSK